MRWQCVERIGRRKCNRHARVSHASARNGQGGGVCLVHLKAITRAGAAEEEEAQEEEVQEEEVQEEEQKRREEMDIRLMAGETQNAENCISQATQHVKESEEFVQKLKVLYTFEQVNVQEKDAAEISQLIMSCQSFEQACCPMPDPFHLAKGFIGGKVIDLNRRIQQALQAQKPWLKTLFDTKTNLEQLLQNNFDLQKSKQLMINHARAVSQQCRQVQREAEEKRRCDELERQQIEMRAALQEQKDRSRCSICLTAEWDTLLSPCGHVICSRCSYLTTGYQCPFCRGRVREWHRVYIP